MKELKKSVKAIIIVCVVAVCVLALVLGLVFGLKENDNNPNNPTPPGSTQPNNPNNPDDTRPTFTIYIDYNLEGDYDKLAIGWKKQDVQQKTAGYELPSFKNTNLSKYLIGWYYESNDNEIPNGIIGPVSATTNEIRVYAKWDNEKMQKYYYSDGLQFEVISGQARVFGYDGSSSFVFLPQKYVNPSNSIESDFIGFSAEAFKNNKVVKEIVLSPSINSIRIEDNAFSGSAIESFDFEKVQYLGAYVFENSSLRSVTFEKSNLTKISSNTFSRCYNLASVILSNKVNIIDDEAFSYCTKLNNLAFLAGANDRTELRDNVFEGCASFVSVEIPKNIAILGVNVFKNCSKLQNVTIFDNNCYVVDGGINDNFSYRFGDLSSSLKTIIFGQGVESIPTYYLFKYEKLTSIQMSDTVTDVGTYAFANCINLLSIKFSNNLSKFDLSAVSGTKWLSQGTQPLVINNILIFVPGGIVDNSGVLDLNEIVGELGLVIKEISANVFVGFDNLRKIIISQGVTNIGNSAFANCTNLSEVEFSSGSELKTISTKAFYGCVNLSNVNFEELGNLISIGENAFGNCSMLAQINLGNSIYLTTIESNAFSNTGHSTASAVVTLPVSIESLGSYVFKGLNVERFKLSGSSKYLKVDDYGVLYVTEGEEKTLYSYPNKSEYSYYIIESDVTKIANYAFSDANFDGKLDYIYIKSSANGKSIQVENYAFDYIANYEPIILSEQKINARLRVLVYYMADIESGDYTYNNDDGLNINDNKLNELSEISSYRFVVIEDNDKLVVYIVTISHVGESVSATYVLLENVQDLFENI